VIARRRRGEGKPGKGEWRTEGGKRGSRKIRGIRKGDARIRKKREGERRRK
jgi:hypothetical protein